MFNSKIDIAHFLKNYYDLIKKLKGLWLSDLPLSLYTASVGSQVFWLFGWIYADELFWMH